MMLVIKAFIPDKPQPKERPRGHVKKDGSIGFRSGKKTSAWEKYARQLLQFARQQAGMHGPVPRDVPVRLGVTLLFPRPQYLGDGPRVRHIVKPDTDNVIKAVKDALDGGKPAKGNRPGTPGLIVTDDCQITSVNASKWYAATGEKPGVHLRLWRLDQHPDIGPDDPARTDKPTTAPSADIGPDDPARTDSSPSSSGSSPNLLACKPHHRWMGGKQKLITELLAAIPAGWSGHYRAPCVGAGSLFYALHDADRLTGATLSDACAPLVGHLQQLRQVPEQLIAQLAIHRERHTPDYWQQARTRFNTLIAPAAAYHDPDPLSLEVAGLFLYLNATCFQGMYRVNGDGGFNTPLSKDRKPDHILSDERAALLRCNAEALREVVLQVCGMNGSIAQAEVGDLLYVDPPYLPGKGKTGFTAYTSEGFNFNDHRLLARSLAEARDRGVLVMTSNNDTAEVRDLYADGWNLRQITRQGTASCDPDNRQPVGELLITSWSEPRPSPLAKRIAARLRSKASRLPGAVVPGGDDG